MRSEASNTSRLKTQRALSAISLALIIAWTMGLSACADPEDAELMGNADKSNRPWVEDSFKQNHPMSDSFFNDVDALTESGAQAFLERSPYGRSWLADHQEGGVRVSRIIIDVANAQKLNPILLLSRMQVEASLISASQRPAQHLIDRAMGCGCPDGRACAAEYLGLKNQILCAAGKFRELYNKSADGSGWWRKGLGKSSLDGYWIVPESHATAALYAYTPWVLKGSGGTWLAWRTAQLFDRHAYDKGFDRLGASGGNTSGGQSGGSSWGQSGHSACESFSDLPGSHPGAGAVQAMVERGWVSGCGEGRFCPEDTLTRAQAAIMISDAFGPSAGSGSGLTDVSGHWARDAIEAVVAAGVMSGCMSDRFCPDDTLTRAQAAVALSKASGIEGWGSSSFKDVPSDHWAARAISGLDERGYIGGCSDDEFCLDAPARRWIFVTWTIHVLQIPYATCQ